MGAVAKGIKKVGGALLGGGGSSTTQSVEGRTEAEAKRLADIERLISEEFGAQGDGGAGAFQSETDDIANMFKQLLQQTLTTDFVNQGRPTAEALAASQEFVDQTFTNPSRVAMQQLGDQFQSDARAKAAALGRNPDIDLGTNQAIFQELARNEAQLQAERGSRIAGRADEVSYQRPMEQAGFQLGAAQQGLGALQQRSGFISDLASRAQQNRMNLLNMRTGLAGIDQAERFKNVSQTTTPQGGGLLGTLGGLGKGALGIGEVGGQLGKMFGGSSGSNQQGPIAGVNIPYGFRSDSLAKENIETLPSTVIDQFLEEITPSKFAYKDDKFRTTVYGVIAQDLEKSELGKSLIELQKIGGYKYVNIPKTVMALLAAVSHLNAKIDAKGSA